jgi:hypothetical protein
MHLWMNADVNEPTSWGSNPPGRPCGDPRTTGNPPFPIRVFFQWYPNSLAGDLIGTPFMERFLSKNHLESRVRPPTPEPAPRTWPHLYTRHSHHANRMTISVAPTHTRTTTAITRTTTTRAADTYSHVPPTTATFPLHGRDEVILSSSATSITSHSNSTSRASSSRPVHHGLSI